MSKYRLRVLWSDGATSHSRETGSVRELRAMLRRWRDVALVTRVSLERCARETWASFELPPKE